MIRVLVMAGDPVLVDEIGSFLAGEIRPDVLQLTYRQPCHFYGAIRDHRSALVVIDEWTSIREPLAQAGMDREDGPLLLIRVSMQTRDIDVQKKISTA